MVQKQSEATNESNEYILDHSTFMDDAHKKLRDILIDHESVKVGQGEFITAYSDLQKNKFCNKYKKEQKEKLQFKEAWEASEKKLAKVTAENAGLEGRNDELKADNEYFKKMSTSLSENANYAMKGAGVMAKQLQQQQTHAMNERAINQIELFQWQNPGQPVPYMYMTQFDPTTQERVDKLQERTNAAYQDLLKA